MPEALPETSSDKTGLARRIEESTLVFFICFANGFLLSFKSPLESSDRWGMRILLVDGSWSCVPRMLLSSSSTSPALELCFTEEIKMNFSIELRLKSEKKYKTNVIVSV